MCEVLAVLTFSCEQFVWQITYYIKKSIYHHTTPFFLSCFNTLVLFLLKTCQNVYHKVCGREYSIK